MNNKKSFVGILLVISMIFGFVVVSIGCSGAQSVSQNLAGTTVTQDWMFPAGGSIVSAPTVMGGFVYAISQNQQGSPAYIYCLNSATGAQFWAQNTTNPIYTPMTVTGGFVYGSVWNVNPSEALNGVFCLNASTGKIIWTYAPPNQTFEGATEVSGGVVYVSADNYTLSTNKNICLVHALNASTGNTLWQFQGPTNIRFSSVIAAGNYVYAVASVYPEKDDSSTSAIYALALASGTNLWSAELSGRIESVIATENTVYASYDKFDAGGTAISGGIIALELSSGKTLWNKPINDLVSGPTIGTDAVFVFSGAGNVYAFRVSDGSMLWNFSSGVRLWAYPNDAAPLLVNGNLYVSNYNGVYCINALNGAQAWAYKTSDYAFAPGSGGAPLATQPAYANGELYLGSGGPEFFSSWTRHNVYALDASNGFMLWNYTVPYNIWTAPTVVNSSLYVAAAYASNENPDYELGGAIYAFKETSPPAIPSTPPTSSPTPRSLPPNAIIVPDNYTNIQNAVDRATSGSTIFVRAGTYYANSGSGIVLDKPLTLMGEQPQTTIIQRTQEKYASSTLDITADNVTVTGFTIAGLANAIGIRIEDSWTHEPSNCKIIGNIVSGARVGIDVYGNYDPLLPFTWHQNTLITQNEITQSQGQGIYISASNTTITGNKIHDNTGDGIIVDSTVNVTIAGNEIKDNGAGTTEPSEMGAGINLRWLGPFLVYGNNITGNGYGVQFGEGANNSTVIGNNITNNYIGVNLLNFMIGGDAPLGTGNTVFQNNFISNSQPTVVETALRYIPSGNYLNGTDSVAWDKGKQGNYWSDYLAKYPLASETDSTGTGNTPYVMDQNNVDHHPLMSAINTSAISPPQTLSPSSNVPEFPSWIILPFLTVVGLLVYLRKRTTV